MRKHSRKSNNSRSINQMSSPIVQRDPVFPPDTTAPLSPSLGRKRKSRIENLTYNLSIESHITIRPRVELSRKRISLLLEQEIVRVNSEGMNLLDYFMLEWCMNYLVGSSLIHEIKFEKMSTAVLAAHTILTQYSENWNLLFQRTSLHPDLSSLLEQIFGKYSDRKYQGRKQIYQLDKFLEVRIENVDSVFERSQNSIRYSSYCKGYGESGRSVRRQKTRYSFELDRDDNEIVTPEEKDPFGIAFRNLLDLYEVEQKILTERKNVDL